MKDWQLDFEWLRVRHFVKDSLSQDSLPDLRAILMLIGIQESNVLQKSWTKEEKQDLMHVATCHILSLKGYYEYVGRDEDGWPHYNQVRILPVEGVAAQEEFLKENVIEYFSEYFIESE